MTTLVNFASSPTAPFQFTPTLNGTQFTAIITWNMYGQRWYLNLYTLNGVLVLCCALIGSPASYPINLVNGFVAGGSLVFYEAAQQFAYS